MTVSSTGRWATVMVAACFGWIPIAAALEGSREDQDVLRDWSRGTSVTLTGWLELRADLTLDDADSPGRTRHFLPLELQRTLDDGCGPAVERTLELRGLRDPEDQALSREVHDLGDVSIRWHRFADPWGMHDDRLSRPSYLMVFAPRMRWGRVVAAIERLQAKRPRYRFLLADAPEPDLSAGDP